MTALDLFQTRLARLRTVTAGAVTARWDALPDHHRERAEPFARAAVPVVAGGQVLASRVTSAYLARRTGVAIARVDPAKVTGAAVRKGVDPVDVYQRPFGIMYGALGDGVQLEQAKARARDRLAVLALADVFLAMRATFSEVGRQTDRITGWVRAADGGACDLCAAADGTAYEDGGDMAGHPGCGCTLEPIFGEPDSSPADPDLIDVHESDELGPVLWDADHSFSS